MVTIPPAKGAESGYTLVALAIAVSILSILLAASLPVWKQIIQREKEEELIFRGWQYAEAIRVFQQRQGRLPTRLDELIKVKPRSIRQLWKDPMTDSGGWHVIFQNEQGGQTLAGGGLPGGGPGTGKGDDGRQDRRSVPTGPNGQPQRVGPIVGVRSLSTDESIKVLFGEEEYDRWEFTLQALSGGGNRPVSGVGPGGVQHGGQLRPVGSDGMPKIPQPRWLGRPFRQGLAPPGGGPGGGLGPGGPNGQGTGPNGRPTGIGPGGPVARPNR